MGLMQRKRPLCKVRPPAKPGACVSLGRASYRQASQEALKKTPPASLALRPVNGRRLSKIIFLAIVKLFISSRFARCWKRKLFTLPSSAGGCHFAKAYKTAGSLKRGCPLSSFLDYPASGCSAGHVTAWPACGTQARRDCSFPCRSHSLPFGRAMALKAQIFHRLPCARCPWS